MGAEVYEEPIEIAVCAMAEAPLAQAPVKNVRRAFPLAHKIATGHIATLRTVAVVVENRWVRAKVLPELGGRIIQISDLRSGVDVLPVPSPFPCDDREGMAWLPDGVQIHWGDWPDPMSYRPVAYKIVAASEQEQPGVWIAGCLPSRSFHAFISVLAEEAEIVVEVRELNRLLRPHAFGSSVTVAIEGAEEVPAAPGEVALFRPEVGCGLSVRSDSSDFIQTGLRESVAVMTRLPDGAERGPRRLDTWTFRIAPFGGIGRPAGVQGGLAASMSAGEVAVAAARFIPGAKIVVRTGSGEQMEAQADLGPTEAFRASLPEAVSGLAVLGKDRRELLRLPPDPQAPAGHDSSELADIGTRAAAHVKRGIAHVQQEDLAEAAASFETALLYNAEDHLSWWAKAVAERRLRDVLESHDLPNAHFLAPLEPVLRAEGFLCSEVRAGSEASAILSSMADRPHELIAACREYFAQGFYADAARLCDEALKLADTVAVRCLLARCYLEVMKMPAEAAAQISAAAKLGFAAPYPDLDDLSVLSAAFGDNETLRVWLRLIPQGIGAGPSA